MIALLALVALTQAPPPLDRRRLSVLQFEVTLPGKMSTSERKAARAIFHADTRTIRACADALRIAARYRAERRFTGTITSRPDIAFASLPAPVRIELTSIPIGHATRVYGPQNRARVLIACTAPTLPKNMGADRIV